MYTRQTFNIIDIKDKTRIECSIEPNCDSLKYCLYYRTMKMWNCLPFNVRQEPRISLFKSKLTKLLWSVDLDWPDNFLYLLNYSILQTNTHLSCID